MSDRSQMAKDMLRREKHGVLSTISAKLDGWPFGSLISYAVLGSGEPVILVSGLAEHTKNIVEDGRVSLFIQDSAARENPQAGARLAIAGRAEPITEERLEEALIVYLQRFPESENLLQLGDFRFYVIDVVRAQFIAGFGQIGWLSAEELK